MIRKSGFILIVLLLCSMSTSGCYDRRELDDMAYVVGIGVDRGGSKLLNITLQVAVPMEIANGGDPKDSFIIKTIEAPTIYSGLDIFNTILNKQVNLSHAKVIVFSKELAKEGLAPYMNEILNGREFRPSMHIQVTVGSAEEYLNKIEPKLQINPAKYHELNHQGYLYTGLSADTRLYDFYIKTKMPHIQPVVALSGELLELKEKEMQIVGLAVFKGTKMVGELSGEEASYYLMTTGEFRISHISISDPIEKDNFVVLKLSQQERPEYEVKIIEGKPDIRLKVKLEADLITIDGYGEHEENNLDIIEKKAAEHIKMGIVKYLNKTKNMEVDVNGFGDFLKRDFYTWRQWEKFNWLDRYKDSVFNVNVSVEIER